MADHTHTIDRWDDATGENLIDRIAAVSDYLAALETYRAAVKRWPKAKITLRNRARVIEQSWEDQRPFPGGLNLPASAKKEPVASTVTGSNSLATTDGSCVAGPS